MHTKLWMLFSNYLFFGEGWWQNFWILQNCRWWLCVKHHSWWMIPMLGFYFHQMLLQELRSTLQWTQAVWVCWSLFKTVSWPIENMLFITQIHNSGFCPLNSPCYTWAETLLYIWSLYIFFVAYMFILNQKPCVATTSWGISCTTWIGGRGYHTV